MFKNAVQMIEMFFAQPVFTDVRSVAPRSRHYRAFKNSGVTYAPNGKRECERRMRQMEKQKAKANG